MFRQVGSVSSIWGICTCLPVEICRTCVICHILLAGEDGLVHIRSWVIIWLMYIGNVVFEIWHTATASLPPLVVPARSSSSPPSTTQPQLDALSRCRLQTTYSMPTGGGGSSDSGTRAANDVGSGPETGSSADPGGEPIELGLPHTSGCVRSVWCRFYTHVRLWRIYTI